MVPRQLEVPFHGYIDKSNVQSMLGEPADGRIEDAFGKSFITDFELGEITLTFMKKYTREGGAPVRYTLTRSVGNELGNHFFSGDWVIGIEDHIIAIGKARCVLTEIPNHFWNKPT